MMTNKAPAPPAPAVEEAPAMAPPAKPDARSTPISAPSAESPSVVSYDPLPQEKV